MRFLVVLGLGLTVAGCAGLTGAHPVATRLSTDMLAVRLSDGQTCRVELAGAGPWSGELAGCGYGYSVTPIGGPNSISAQLVQFAPAIFAPSARIVLTDARGQGYDFTSPLPVPLD